MATATDIFNGGVNLSVAKVDSTDNANAKAPNPSIRAADMPQSSTTNRLFKNIFSGDGVRFAGFTPHIGGRGFFIVTKMPAYMNLDTTFKNESELYKKLIQFYTKGISGFQDKQMGFVEISNGIDNNTLEIPSTITGASRDIQFQFGPELKGQFITKYTKLWMEGVVDPNTHDAHYHGAIANGMEFDQENHTMEGIYFVTDPSRRKIVFHSYLVNMFPKIGHSAFNDTVQGTHEHYEPAINFTAQSFENNISVGEFLTKMKIVDLVATDKHYEFNFTNSTATPKNGDNTGIPSEDIAKRSLVTTEIRTP